MTFIVSMFPIAAQTAGPNGLTFSKGTQGYPGVKKTKIFKIKKKSFSKKQPRFGKYFESEKLDELDNNILRTGKYSG